MSVTHLLLETAVGYTLWTTKSIDSIGKGKAQAEALSTLNNFSKLVQLVTFLPFQSAARLSPSFSVLAEFSYFETEALENINDVSEGVLNEYLESLLLQNLPANKAGLLLGVSERSLAGAIKSTVGISCDTSDRTLDLLRALRLHAEKLIPGLSEGDIQAAQLGLGHAYSRAKVKFNVNRSDNMIIQAIALLDQLDKDVNTFSMRVREWYGWHFPELVKVVPDNQQYAKMVHLIGDKVKLSSVEPDDAFFSEMVEITQDESTARSVLDAAKTSMGQDISPIDLINISNFSSRVIHLYAYRTSLQTYLNEKMSMVAPNLGALVGDVVAARLISHAGSLTNLSKYPASTVQILGAEKALFRALKTKGNTPKYGLIYHSTFIGRAVQKNKGRISRFLANKCSIASRIDCFSDAPSTKFGEALRDQVEERLAFYETGSNPTKNADAMAKVLAAIKSEAVPAEAPAPSTKKSKKRKSEAVAEVPAEAVEAIAQEMEDDSPRKKKKSKKSKDAPKESDTPATALSAAPPVDAMDIDEAVPIKKAKKEKKKRDAKAITDETPAEAIADPVEPAEPSAKPKKKKKKSGAAEADVSMSLDL